MLKFNYIMNINRRYKVVFLPYGKGNPYPELLKKAIENISSFEISQPLLNPIFLKRLYDLKPDIIHIHWLESFYKSSSFLLSLIKSLLTILQFIILKKKLCTSIVWTVHNLFAHDGVPKKIDKFTRKIFIKLTDTIIVHSYATKQKLIVKFNADEEKIYIIPHGNFIEVYGPPVEKIHARNKLGIPNNVFIYGFFGSLRPYKGVEILIKIFKEIKIEIPDSALFICGKPISKKYENLIKSEINNQNNIFTYFNFIPESEVATFLGSFDVLVLPFKEITTSGSLICGMSLGLPCIVPDFPELKEYIGEDGGWVYDPENPSSLKKAMLEAQKNRHQLLINGLLNLKRAEKLSWENVGMNTAELYKLLVNKKSS